MAYVKNYFLYCAGGGVCLTIVPKSPAEVASLSVPRVASPPFASETERRPPVPANHPTECLPTAGSRRPLPRVPPAPSYQPRFARPSQRSLDSLRSSASASSLCTKWNVDVDVDV